jgi:uncharacterized delta-60 repeat protein
MAPISLMQSILRCYQRKTGTLRDRYRTKNRHLRVEELEGRALPSASGLVPIVVGVPVQLGPDNPSAAANAVAFQVGNGATKTLVAGYDTVNGNQEFALWRFNADGSLDTSFGQGGLVTTDIGAGQGNDWAAATALAIDPVTGDIVLGGYASDSNTNNLDFALAVYHADGTPDASFGTGGIVTTGVASSDAEVNALAIDPNTHQIVVAGWATDSATWNQVFALARYNFDGSLDAGFGTGGIVTTDFGNGAEISALAIDGAGRYVAAGSADDGTTYQNAFALARYNADGSLDTSFGAGSGSFGPAGTVTTEFGTSDAQINALAINALGQYVAAGSAYNDTTYNNDLALARYNADGSLDSSFGPAGTVTTDLGTGDAQANALVLDAGTGQLVVAGSVGNNATGVTSLSVTRYNADGSLDTGFGTGGTVTVDFGAGGFAQASGLAADGQGGYLAVGSAFNGGTWNDNVALARLDATGNLDPTFGAGTAGNLGPAGTVSWNPPDAVPWQPGAGGTGGGVPPILYGAGVPGFSGPGHNPGPSTPPTTAGAASSGRADAAPGREVPVATPTPRPDTPILFVGAEVPTTPSAAPSAVPTADVPAAPGVAPVAAVHASAPESGTSQESEDASGFGPQRSADEFDAGDSAITTDEVQAAPAAPSVEDSRAIVAEAFALDDFPAMLPTRRLGTAGWVSATMMAWIWIDGQRRRPSSCSRC